GNTSPMDVSSLSNPVFWMRSTKTTVMTPVKAASNINNGEFKSCVRKNPMTIPGRMAWLMASLIMAILRSTKNVPGMAQATATKLAISCISSCVLCIVLEVLVVQIGGFIETFLGEAPYGSIEDDVILIDQFL